MMWVGCVGNLMVLLDKESSQNFEDIEGLGFEERAQPAQSIMG